MIGGLRKITIERYFPNTVSPSQEFKEYKTPVNIELNKVNTILYKWFLNTFIADADSEGISKWEEMLKITPKITDTIEERRERVKFRINNRNKYTHRQLQIILDSVYGYGEPLIRGNEYTEYRFILEIGKGLLLKLAQLYTYLRCMIPSNLVLLIWFVHRVLVNVYSASLIMQKKQTYLNVANWIGYTDCIKPVYAGVSLSQLKRTLI